MMRIGDPIGKSAIARITFHICKDTPPCSHEDVYMAIDQKGAWWYLCGHSGCDFAVLSSAYRPKSHKGMRSHVYNKHLKNSPKHYPSSPNDAVDTSLPFDYQGF